MVSHATVEEIASVDCVHGQGDALRVKWATLVMKTKTVAINMSVVQSRSANHVDLVS